MTETFTRSKMTELQRKLDQLISEFAEEHGLNVTPTNIRFNDTEFETRMRFSTKESNPLGLDPRFKHDLIIRGAQYGLTTEMRGTKFETKNGTMEFVGMRATKVMLRDASGKLFTVRAVLVAPKIIEIFNKEGSLNEAN